MKTAFLFPGQGAQAAGMGQDLIERYPQARNLFDLRQLCTEGPAEKLNATTVSQPAIFAVSAALLDLFGASGIAADVTAGLSMGEYTALYAAGLLSFEDGLKLVQQRGDAMQRAADASDGSMVSIIGLDEAKVIELCKEASQGELLIPVNYNCPGQIVISGAAGACKRAVELAPKYEAIKAIPLSVAGAFHSEMMKPAADELAGALAACPIQEPGKIKVIANISADYYTSADAVRNGLVKQLIEPILWQACMEKLLADGIENFYEIGPGRVLTGLMKRINRKTNVVNVSSADAVEV
jgi:[acyl-carrier-protein] S-malonyltransferase